MLDRLALPRSSALLIDGSNLHAATKALGFTIDYKRLIESFEGTIYKSFYFTALPPDNEQSTIRPMVDYIEFNGFTVIKKLLKEFDQTSTFRCESCGEQTTRNSVKIKGNMDVELAVIALEVAPHCSHIYLFTGDGDFRFLVETLQRRFGCYVTVVSTVKTKPMMCADILRRQADAFIDLADMREGIERKEVRRV
jgi:uncharacterized LabA/DUF88 family protein